MIEGNKVLALIPARGGSKGLPGKNIKDLCGMPLLAWPIRAARESNYIDQVIVSTENKNYADIARSYGASVPFIRPAKLARDDSTTYLVVEHALNYLKSQNEIYDYMVLLEPTSPLTTSKDIDEALKLLISKRDLADSVVGVSKVEATHPVFDVRINDKGLIEPYVGNGFNIFKRQEIDKLYYFEGSLYISDLAILIREKSFYHNRTLPYIVPRWKAIEIDELVDYVCAEAILQNIEILNKDSING